VQVSGLVGVALDWAVAKSDGWSAIILPVHAPSTTYYVIKSPSGLTLSPSTNWNQCGPLIGKYLMDFCCEHPETIGAALCDENGMYIDDRMMFGETHLIAACRAIVAAHLGEVVSVPAELAS
jgi:hypothetical protein